LDLFAKDGLAGTQTVGSVDHESALEPYRELLTKEFDAQPPRTVSEARRTVARLTKVELKNDAIRRFMYSLGMEYRKVGSVPSKADPERQEEFKKKSSNLDLKRQKKAKGRSSLWTQPTLSSAASWGFSGR
jgi:transposase